MDQAPAEPLKQIKPEVEEADTAATDASDPAVQETVQLTRGKSTKEIEEQLEHTAKMEEADRDKRFRDAFEQLAIWAMRLIFITLTIIGAVWLLNILLPEHCTPSACWGTPCLCRWLTPDQVTILQDILTGGLIGGLLADHFRKRIGR